MYKRDTKRIKEYAEEIGPDGLLAVGAFVLSTIQTPLSRTGDMVADIKLKGTDSPHLWGNKRGGYHHLWVYRKELYDLLITRRVGREDAMFRLLAVPGLGLPKAAFLLQCVGYETACIDSHNLKRYNLNPNVTKVGRVKPDTVIKKVDNYLTLCDNIGSSESHWNDWCKYVAGNRVNKLLPTADEVSAYHYKAITGV